MPITNVNLKTGIRYGIIAANSLEDWVIDEITSGEELEWKHAIEELTSETRAEAEKALPDGDEAEIAALAEELLNERSEELSNHWDNSEPTYQYEIDGVRGETTHLGGAMLVWVFESPVISKARLCSPCVPNCGDLDTLSENGQECYGVPDDWRRKS